MSGPPPVGTASDTPASLRRKAREFLRLAEEAATAETAVELRRLAQRYLDYADFLADPGQAARTPRKAD